MEGLISNDLFVSQHNSGYNVTRHMYLGDKLCTSRMNGTGEMGEFIGKRWKHMVTIVLTVEDPWSALGGPFLSFAQIGLENAHHFLRPQVLLYF